MKLWRYVIATNNGTAPSYLPPALTLALCKPRIRAAAQPGDVVLAFAGAGISRDPEAVVWAGVVTESLSFAQYWYDPRFASKKVPPLGDNIYEPHPAEPSGHHQHSHAHHGPGSARTDLGGQRVLIFGGPATWVFHDPFPSLPHEFGLSMGAARRNHQVGTIQPNEWAHLRAWLSGQPAHDVQPAFHVPFPTPIRRAAGRAATNC